MISALFRVISRPWLLVLLLSLPGVGCLPALRSVTKTVPVGTPFLLYLQALPPEAADLRFVFAQVAVIDESGVPWPLTLHLPELTAGTVNRQRLFASGRLPVGRYSGVSLVCKGAWLQTDEGEVALRVGAEPLLVPSRFAQLEEGGGVLEMAYRHDGGLQAGRRFTPMLVVYPPARPLADRVGILNCGAVGYLTIFDRKTMDVQGVVGTGGRLPGGMVFDDHQRRLYLAMSDDDLVEVVDPVSGDRVGRMQLRPGDRPGSLALSPDGRLLLVACPGSDVVLIFDVLTQIELARVSVDEEPVFILPDRRNQRAYVFSKRAATVTVLDLVKQLVVATLPLDVGPFRGALSRDGSRLYVLHQGSPYLSVLDTRSLGLLERLQVGLGGSVMLIDPRTDLLYLGRSGEKRLEIYSSFSQLPVDFLEVPAGPGDLVIADEENQLLLALPGQAGLAAIDLISRQVVGRLEAGAEPHDLVVAGARLD